MCDTDISFVYKKKGGVVLIADDGHQYINLKPTKMVQRIGGAYLLKRPSVPGV